MEAEDIQRGWRRPQSGFRPPPGRRLRLRRSPSRLGRAFGVLGAAGAVAVGCIAILLAVSWIRSQGAVRVVRAQAEAIREGKVEQAYALFSKGYRAENSLPVFRRWLRRQGYLTSAQNLQIRGRSVWGGTAVLWGNFQDDVGHSYPVRYLLIRESGSWRVDSLQLPGGTPDSSPRVERFLNI